MRLDGDGQTRIVPGPSGRSLAVCEWGAPDGQPMFVLHGTPGSRFLRHVEPAGVYTDIGARVLTYDRPGYGLSTRFKGRRVADAAADVAAIADAIELRQFGVLGISGGAPCALAVAALLPERVTRCATVVGTAPMKAPGLDFFAGMDEEGQVAWRRDEPALEARWVELFGDLDANAESPPRSWSDEMSEADAIMLDEALRESVRQGSAGWVDDSLSLLTDWGFPLDKVVAPTTLMQARGDLGTPAAHGEWLVSQLPDAELVWVGGDHFGPRAEPEMALLRWVCQAVP
jgi:pimeloyl-ACP methyl ester carboxylesterase